MQHRAGVDRAVHRPRLHAHDKWDGLAVHRGRLGDVRRSLALGQRLELAVRGVVTVVHPRRRRTILVQRLAQRLAGQGDIRFGGAADERLLVRA